jgi:transcription initiation factor TFIIB
VFQSQDKTNLCNKAHPSTITDAEVGEVICISCGMVVSDKAIEIGPEWSAFTNDKLNSARVGMPVSLAKHDQGLSTVIGRDNRDFSGETIIDPSSRSIIERLRTWDYRTQTRNSRTRSRIDAFRQLDRLKQKLALPDPVVQKAAYIYRKVQQKEIVRGRTRNGAMAGCVYIACREARIPRTFDEVAGIANITRKEVSNAYIAIVLGLDLRIPLIDPVRCLVKLANKAQVDEKIKRYAIGYLKQIIDSNLSAGKDPMSIAATVLYLACLHYGDQSKTQRYFAEAAGISDVTIRNRRQEIQNKIPFLTSRKVANHGGGIDEGHKL